jgi:glycosyltransferase involved in cell wall biosynthesis
VLGVIRNLVKYATADHIEQHIIYTVNRDELPDFVPGAIEGSASEKVFRYSSRSNFYSTCSKLSELIPGKNAVLVAHDWLELGMISNLGLQNPVIQVLHGDYPYYYQLARKHEPWIDSFITVAGSIQQKLLEDLPDRSRDISYLRFPVPDTACKSQKASAKCNIAFIGRATEDKGFNILNKIRAFLDAKNSTSDWHFAGFKDHQGEAGLGRYHGILTSSEVRELLCDMHIMVLPSLAEGMPLTLIEAMKARIVPVVNDLPGGIQELIEDGITGYRIKNNSPEDFADAILVLESNKELLEKLSRNCIERANELFDPEINGKAYYNEYMRVSGLPRKIKKAEKIYGSRMDQSWIPNLITKLIRQLR